jgi:hypothetical protein
MEENALRMNDESLTVYRKAAETLNEEIHLSLQLT